MIAWIFGKLKALFLLAAIGGPAVAGYMWWDAERIKDVETRGVEATAAIEGATRTKRRRGGTSYDIDLAWKDQKGAAREAKKVYVSTTFANQIIRNERIIRDKVKIKYLADDADAKPILIEDAGRQAEADTDLMWIGAGTGAVGILGSLIFFAAGRFRRAQPA